MASPWNLYSDAAYRGICFAEIELNTGTAPIGDDVDGLVRRIRSATRHEYRPSAFWRGYLTYMVVRRYVEIDAADLVCMLLSDTRELLIEHLPRTWLSQMRMFDALYGANWRRGYAAHR